MELRTKIVVTIDFTEEHEGLKLKEIENIAGFEINSKEHIEHIQEGLTEILSEGMGVGVTVNDVVITSLEAE